MNKPHNIFFSFPFFSLFIFSLLNLQTEAQEDANPVQTEEGASSIRVRLLALSRPAAHKKVLIKSGDYVSDYTEFTTHGLSKSVYIKNRELLLGLAAEVEGGDIKSLATCSLPDEGKDFVVLVVLHKGNYKCLPVRLDGGNLMGSDVLFLNISPVTTGGKVGEQKFVAKPFKPVIIKSALAESSANGKPYLLVKFYYSRNNKTRLLADTRWPIIKRSRSFVFFYVNPDTKMLTYRAVEDVLPRR